MSANSAKNEAMKTYLKQFLLSEFYQSTENDLYEATLIVFKYTDKQAVKNLGKYLYPLVRRCDMILFFMNRVFIVLSFTNTYFATKVANRIEKRIQDLTRTGLIPLLDHHQPADKNSFLKKIENIIDLE